jgi:hypothetical protein
MEVYIKWLKNTCRGSKIGHGDCGGILADNQFKMGVPSYAKVMF